MSNPIQTADDRLAEPGKINILITAPHGTGKTSLARTLPNAGAQTLFIDGEAGMKALEGNMTLPDGQILPPFGGGSISVRVQAAKLKVHPWFYTKALTCLLCGPDPAASNKIDQETGLYPSYSEAAHQQYVAGIGDPSMFDAFNTIFVDSGSVMSKLAWSWSLTQPRSFNKQGKQDTLGAYGLVGDEVIDWATQLQHISGKTVILLFALDIIKDKDIPGRVSYDIQSIGSRADRELPGIFDNVMTLGQFTQDANGGVQLDYEKGKLRGLICQSASGFGVPVKDRTGKVDVIERPDLSHILNKLNAKERTDTLNTSNPTITTAA